MILLQVLVSQCLKLPDSLYVAQDCLQFYFLLKDLLFYIFFSLIHALLLIVSNIELGFLELMLESDSLKLFTLDASI